VDLGGDLAWQGSLLDAVGDAATIVAAFTGLVRHQLDAASWVDHCPGWVSGAEQLFEELLQICSWRQHDRLMYGSSVAQPRLNASWKGGDGSPVVPVVAEMQAALTARYQRTFDSGGLNLYRDGRDSVAWHRDRIAKEIVDPVVGIVSLGSARTFRLRPRGGGPSTLFVPQPGDLIVTGGQTQRTWEHTVPKVAHAGPRISMTFRHSANGPTP
jgi:alkylated DNA repair dioxygenase AlkB